MIKTITNLNVISIVFLIAFLSGLSGGGESNWPEPDEIQETYLVGSSRGAWCKM